MQKIHRIFFQVAVVTVMLSVLDKDYYGAEAIAAYRKDPKINFIYAHTSGHATVEDLKTFAGALKPKMLVPVHTAHANVYSQRFKNVKQLRDGEVATI